jgi:GTP:adenosylcobinamide-phosphate guanylyltransferase
MDAIITAGGIPKPDDLLYPLTGGISKALVEIAGKPMVQWVLDALDEAETIERILIIGLDPDSGVSSSKPLTFIPNQGAMLDNIRTGVRKGAEINPEAEHTLLVSSDIPAITGEMVDWSVNTSMETDEDIYYSVIPRDVMEKSFPESNRSYIKLKDMDVCGADMNMIRISVATGRDEIWKKLIASRKSALKQASLIGYDTLILMLLRRLTLEKLVKTVTTRLDLTGRALISPYAEVGMDVDKPYQYELLSEYLKNKTSP